MFVMCEFGSEGNFAISPQLLFLTRGGKLTDIANVDDNYESDGVKDIFYSLRSRYVDVRVPLIYQFGKASSKIRPCVFVAPVLGFATTGDIMLISENER